MFLGITDHVQEKKRITINQSIKKATIVFVLMLFLPFALYALFHFGIIAGKPAFSTDIQEPVAMVTTGTSTGTAFLINPTTLLTARHVVEEYAVGEQVDLLFDQTANQYQTKATIKYIAPLSGATGEEADYFLTDVAVLEVVAIEDITPLTLGESGSVENLDEVILIGYPNGDFSITKGNINSGEFQGLNMFKLDAATNPGNSGGPCLLANDHTVIGIMVATNAEAQQGENVALKIDEVKVLLEQAGVPF